MNLIIALIKPVVSKAKKQAVVMSSSMIDLDTKDNHDAI